MKPQQARQVVAHLKDAYPRTQLTAGNVGVYEKSLGDFTEDEVLRAINEWAASERFFPAISDLRLLVIEERLQLPSADEAWELVRARLAWRPSGSKPCVTCASLGTRMYEPGDETRQVSEIACPDCNGVGSKPVGQAPTLDAATDRALDFVGGPWAVRNATEPGILRAQFLKAHERFRTSEIRTANLVSLGVLEPAARRLSLEGGQ